MVMDTPPSHLYITPMRASVKLSQNAQAIANHKFIFIPNFHMKRKCVVYLHLLAVKVLSYIGYLVPAFRRAEFFLQVFMADFHLCRKGKWVETLGLWIVTSSVTFIKSVNQSSIKPCLIVLLVAAWTLIYFKCKVVCSFVSEESCEKYSIVAFVS